MGAPLGQIPMQGQVAVAPTNAFAIVSLILGLVGVSLLAIIFGHMARHQIRATGQGGDGMALAGLILGYAGLVVVVVVVAVIMNPFLHLG
ncbi:MAG: DUF4190 domain-containing protein [Propionibacterium sp.]|nr:DUF4190 domain-containing protein [Propionibacterium sp.]